MYNRDICFENNDYLKTETFSDHNIILTYYLNNRQGHKYITILCENVDYTSTVHRCFIKKQL